MADCDCDFCYHAGNDCPHVWTYSECYVDTILAAKTVVDDEFISFMVKLESKNKELHDDAVECLIGWMRNVIQNSHQPLPEWAVKENL